LSSLQVKLQATCHVLNELNAGLINLSADDDSKIREDCKSLIDKFFALIDVEIRLCIMTVGCIYLNPVPNIKTTRRSDSIMKRREATLQENSIR
jgi:hypothetical protein